MKDNSGVTTAVSNLSTSVIDCPPVGYECGGVAWTDYDQIRLRSGEKQYVVPFEQISRIRSLGIPENPLSEVLTKKGVMFKGIPMPTEKGHYNISSIKYWYFRGQTSFGEFLLPIIQTKEIIFGVANTAKIVTPIIAGEQDGGSPVPAEIGNQNIFNSIQNYYYNNIHNEVVYNTNLQLTIGAFSLFSIGFLTLRWSKRNRNRPKPLSSKESRIHKSQMWIYLTIKHDAVTKVSRFGL